MNQPLDPLKLTGLKARVDEATAANAPHEVERLVLQRLQNHPSLRFSTLNVHRCDRESICIEGFLESNDEAIDLCEVVRGIHGIKQVVNRVVTTHQPVPRKG